MWRHWERGRIVAIFFSIVVVVVSPEQRKEVCGLDLGRQIWLPMQALRPTTSLRRCAQVVDIWKRSYMYSKSIPNKIVSWTPTGHRTLDIMLITETTNRLTTVNWLSIAKKNNTTHVQPSQWYFSARVQNQPSPQKTVENNSIFNNFKGTKAKIRSKLNMLKVPFLTNWTISNLYGKKNSDSGKFSEV